MYSCTISSSLVWANDGVYAPRSRAAAAAMILNGLEKQFESRNSNLVIPSSPVPRLKRMPERVSTSWMTIRPMPLPSGLVEKKGVKRWPATAQSCGGHRKLSNRFVDCVEFCILAKINNL